MKMYTPFKKELSDIDEQELLKLIEDEIAEGLFIEYKSDIPRHNSDIDKNKVVKSISAFANTRGGWIFWGVESNSNNIATNLCGIDMILERDLPDKISKIISANISSTPIFHFKIVELSNGKSVFIIQVEEGPVPPYLTSKGVIYQRENNECNPIKDRYVIEKLTERAEEYYSAIERFCSIDYGETRGQSESNQSYLELYLFPLPYGSYKFEKFYETEFFKNVSDRFYQGIDFNLDLKNGTVITSALNLGFNSIYSSQNSLIIRPLDDRNIIYKTTTAELFQNGNLKFLIPLPEFCIRTVPKHYEDSEVTRYLNEWATPLLKEGEFVSHPESLIEDPEDTFRRRNSDFIENIRMIDGAEFIYYMLVITSKYKTILEDCGFDLSFEIGYRARVTKTWRKFVFFDNHDYLEKLKLYNLPVAPKDNVEVPRFVKGNYYPLDLRENSMFFVIAKTVLDAIGLPDSGTIDFTDIICRGLERFENKG